MEQTVVNDEIDILHDFGRNIDVNQELSGEVPIVTVQNVNEKINNAYPITQEMHDDFNTVIISEMKMEQTVVKDEIDIDDDFGWNIDIKQELSEEMHDEFNIVHTSEEFMVPIKTERDSSDNNDDTHNIINKLNNIKVKRGRPTKSKGLPKKGKYANPNHCTKQKKLLYKTIFRQKNISYRKGQVTDLTILRNIDEDEKNEIAEDDLKAEWTDIKFTDNFKLNIDEGQKLKRSELVTHLRSHTGENQFKCNICLKHFAEKSSLAAHSRTHTGEKPFECNICLKSFAWKSSLTSHLRSHTGEKPFKCNICPTTFAETSSLTSHVRTHTGEKPFKCHICLKSFSKKCSLTRHLRCHTGEKPFKCDICLKTFSHKSQLKLHVCRNTGEKYQM